MITCSLLSDLRNGRIVYKDNVTEQLVFGTVATHSCDEGHFLVGDSVRTCEGNGSTVEGKWSGTGPVCSGRSFFPCLNNYLIATVKHYFCVVTFCEPLSFLNGAITYSPYTVEPFYIGTIATYTCDEGYSLAGPRARVCEGNDSVIGEWSESAPLCTSKFEVYVYIHFRALKHCFSPNYKCSDNVSTTDP